MFSWICLYIYIDVEIMYTFILNEKDIYIFFVYVNLCVRMCVCVYLEDLQKVISGKK